MALDDSRIAGGEAVGGDVPRDDTPGGDDRAVTDGHTGADDHATTEPAVLADGDRVSHLHRSAALHGIKWMSGGVELALRSDASVCTYGDQTAVQQNAVGIDEDLLTQPDAVTVVAVKGGNDGSTLRDAGDQLLQYSTVVGVPWVERAETAAETGGVAKALRQLGRGVVVESLAPHIIE